MTVVAEEDWMTAVMPAPTRMPRKRLEVSRSRMPFMRPFAVARRGLQAGAHHLHAVKEQGQAAQQPQENAYV